MFGRLKGKGFEIETLHHAEAILTHDMPSVAVQLEEILLDLRVSVEELVRGGSGEAGITKRLRRTLTHRGWKKHGFQTRKIVNGEEKEATSHKVDHVLRLETGTFGLELEGNNKDAFFDRDLGKFRRLHAGGPFPPLLGLLRGARPASPRLPTCSSTSRGQEA